MNVLVLFFFLLYSNICTSQTVNCVRNNDGKICLELSDGRYTFWFTEEGSFNKRSGFSFDKEIGGLNALRDYTLKSYFQKNERGNLLQFENDGLLIIFMEEKIQYLLYPNNDLEAYKLSSKFSLMELRKLFYANRVNRI